MDTKPNFRLLRRSFIAGGHASAPTGDQESSASNDENLNAARNQWTARTLPRSFGRSRSAAASSVEVSDDGEIVMRSGQGAPVITRRRPASRYSTADTRSAIHTTRPISGLVTIDGKFLATEWLLLRRCNLSNIGCRVYVRVRVSVRVIFSIRPT